MAIDLSGLNPEQRQAVLHQHGPLLVLAGAGSGKTRVVTHRIGRLLEVGVSPKNILALTFTNKAAKEMRERLRALVGVKACSGMILSTFHSLCARILRKDAAHIGFSPRFSILDTSDQIAQLLRVAKEHGISFDEVKPQQVLGCIGWYKNQNVQEDNFPIRSGEPAYLIARQLYYPYRQHLRALHAVDFDDLMLLTVEILSKNPDVKKYYQNTFEYILIDEYQDTNPIQMDLVNLLISPKKNICVVGDDDQAIYGFRGSAIKNILNFDQDFAPCTVVNLARNYRSSAPIIHAANSLIKNNEVRREKQLIPVFLEGEKPYLVPCPSGEDEARFVAETIKEILKKGAYLPGDVALLYRAGPQSRSFEEALRAEQIPYRVVGGQEFLERKDVKNTLAYLHLIADPNQEIAFRRVINLPARSLGEKAVQMIVDEAKKREISLLDLGVEERFLDLKPKAKRAYRQFSQNLLKAKRVIDNSEDPFEALSECIYAAGMQEYINKEKDLKKRIKIKEAIEEVIDAYALWGDRIEEARQNPDLQESWLVDMHEDPLISFLQRLALDEEERKKEKERQKEEGEKISKAYVTLMSMHASKGLEFPVVFIVGFEEGLLPHRRSLEEGGAKGIEEERRLCYVGITRAKNELYMTYCTHRRKRGQMIKRDCSRFTADITADLLQESGPWAIGEKSDTDLASDFFSKMRS